MSLRDVLAELDVKVRGAGAVTAANAELDRYVQSLAPADAAIEDLRVRQAEAAEMASRLGQRIRGLQAAEGNHAAEIEQLRRAQFRAADAARAHGAEIAQLERAEEEAAEAARKYQEDTAALPGAILKTGEATQQTGTWVQRLEQRMQNLLDPTNLAVAGLAAIAAAGYAVARGVRAAIDELGELIDEGHELANLAARLNVSTTELQRWRFIADQTDLEATALTSSFGALARNVEAAAHGGGPAAADFRRLGVSLRDGNGHLRTQGELFADTVRALSTVTDRTRRAAIAQRIFSEGGTQLLALIDEGPEAIDRLSTRFDELGGGLSEEVVAGAEEAHDALGEFDVLVNSFRSMLAQQVLPVLNHFLAWWSDYASGIGRALERSSAMWLAWGALRVAGSGVEIVLTALARNLYALFRPLVVAVLFFEDFVTALRGGRSVIADAYEESTGGTETLLGALDRLGLGWERVEARAARALATMLEGLSIAATLTGADPNNNLSSLALAWRDRAAIEESEADDADRSASAREAGRLFSRKVASDPTIATRNRDAAASVSATIAPTYIINAHDPDGVRREIEAHDRRRAREAADALPLAGAT